MKRKAIVFLWMSISCLLVFTVLSLDYAESEISSADSASVFFSVIDEFRAAIHDPHYDSNFKDSFFHMSGGIMSIIRNQNQLMH